MAVKKSSQLTLRDRLSRLTFQQACKWLGSDGAKLIAEAGRVPIDPAGISWPDARTLQIVIDRVSNVPVVVTLTLEPAARSSVRWACSEQEDASFWFAAALSHVLEEKVSLGLAAPPDETNLPWEQLDASALERRALAEREQRAREETMKIKRRNGDPGPGRTTSFIVR